MTKQEILKVVIDEPHRLGWGLGFTKLKPIHSDWIRYTWDGGAGARALMAYRGSYKSSAVIITGVIRRLLLTPYRSISLCRKNFFDAVSYCKTIGRHLEREGIRKIAFDLWGKTLEKTMDNQNGLILSIGDRTPERPNLRPFGVGTAITGAHADDVVFDDIITIDDRVSKNERERTSLYISEVVTNVLNPGGRAIFLGTKWHEKDAWNDIKNYSAIKVHRLSDGCFNMTPEEIEERKRRISPLLWAANYEMDASGKENQIFTDPRYGERLNAEYWRTGRATYMHMDAAYGGGDTTALTVMQGNTVRGWLWTDTVLNHIDDIKTVYANYNVSRAFIETNADKGLLAEKLNERGTHWETYHESMNKQVKIMSVIYPVWTELRFDPDTAAEYLEQIVDWVDKIDIQDDAPDSLASCILHSKSGLRGDILDGIARRGT
jgi:hypothetical protein